MAQYADGFLIPIPKDQIDNYREIARFAGSIWKEHGAVAYYECVGDDLDVKDQISFPTLTGAEPGETVILAWIIYNSREHRDEVNAKVMADPRMTEFMKDRPMPFDCRRMAYGGFRTLVIA